jgi:hypothetical protein
MLMRQHRQKGKYGGKMKKKKQKNGLIRNENAEDLHQKLLRISLWDSLNKDRKQPISFAFKLNSNDIVNRALAVEYLNRMRQRGE